MTVTQLREQMSSDEYQRWGVYYARIAQRLELERLKQQQQGGGGTGG